MPTTPVYELTAQASAGGSVTPSGTSWVEPTQTVNLVASADPGYTLVGWTGSGPGSTTTTGTNPPTEINVTLPTGPVSELATFAPNATPMYVVTVTATGLPSGGTYAVTFDGTTYYGNGTFALPAYLGGDYTISVPIAYDNSNSLVRFLPLNFTTTGLATGPGGTFGLSSNGGSIDIDFATQYALTVSVSGPGSTTPVPGLYWESTGNVTALAATPSSGYVFDQWSGTGAGSANSSTPSFQLLTSGPAEEAASFSPYVPPPPAIYTLTLVESGLPAGVAWWASDGATGVGSSTGTLALTGLNGTYSVSLPAVRISPGDQFVSNLTEVSEVVTSNRTVDVTFSGQYMLTVSTGAGGSATPLSEWNALGASVPIAASPAAGYSFVGWVGSGPGNYTGSEAAATVTMNGPITETAQFAAKTPPPTTQAAPSPLPSYLPWVALVVLLALGAVGGYMISRGKGGDAARPAGPSPESAEASQGGSPASDAEPVERAP